MTDLQSLPKVIGTKQTLRALETGKVKLIILADDTEQKIKSKIEKAGQAADVKIVPCESKKALGLAGGINRDAAVIAILND